MCSESMQWIKDESILTVWRVEVEDIDTRVKIEQMPGIEVFKWEVTRSDGVLYNFTASCAADSFALAVVQVRSIVDAIRSWNKE